jgi:hypothetical protein
LLVASAAGSVLLGHTFGLGPLDMFKNFEKVYSSRKQQNAL